jgi:hypothetical protein
MNSPWQSIVETQTFLHMATGCMSDAEREALKIHLANNPKAGVVIEGTGGFRKLRWAVGGRGKSGGVRVIYYHHDETLPIFLFVVYGKNERANLSKAEKNELKALKPKLVEAYRRKESRR